MVTLCSHLHVGSSFDPRLKLQQNPNRLYSSFPHPSGIKFLKHMHLTHLNLDGTGVSLAGITSLLGLSNICCVRATNTRVIPLDDVSDLEWEAE